MTKSLTSKTFNIRNIRLYIHKILDVPQKTGSVSWYFDIFIIVLIFLNVLAILLESIEPILNRHEVEFKYFEYFSVTIFTIEYLLRIWTADLNTSYKKPIIGNIKFIFTPFAIIDLLAILPFYLPFIGIDMRFLRLLRIFRIFRVFRVSRYIMAIDLLVNVFKKKKEELVISSLITLLLLLIASTLMYYAENEAQPEYFSSIPETMWWGITTLTTVGYGDMFPVTGMGRFLGGIIAFIGIGLFALPTGILASGFSEELSLIKIKSKACPTCGQDIKK